MKSKINPVGNSISRQHSAKSRVTNGMNRREFIKALGLGAAAQAGDQSNTSRPKSAWHCSTWKKI